MAVLQRNTSNNILHTAAFQITHPSFRSKISHCCTPSLGFQLTLCAPSLLLLIYPCVYLCIYLSMGTSLYLSAYLSKFKFALVAWPYLPIYMTTPPPLTSPSFLSFLWWPWGQGRRSGGRHWSPLGPVLWTASLRPQGPLNQLPTHAHT